MVVGSCQLVFGIIKLVAAQLSLYMVDIEKILDPRLNPPYVCKELSWNWHPAVVAYTEMRRAAQCGFLAFLCYLD